LLSDDTVFKRISSAKFEITKRGKGYVSFFFTNIGMAPFFEN